MGFVGIRECGKPASSATGARRFARARFYGVCGLLFAVCAGASIAACVSMSAMSGMPMPGGWTLSMMWVPMCGQTWPGAAASFVGMWAVMMVAMMLPSIAPALWRYGEALRSAGHTRAGALTGLAAVGYFSVWAALGVAVFALGAAFAALQMRLPTLARAVPEIAGVTVVIGGALQMSAWKAHYLLCCRQAPQSGHVVVPWPAGAALRYGLRVGLHCCCCCASFTAVLVAIGVMDPAAMAAAMAAITLERFAPRGELVARGIGVAIVGMGVLMITRAASLL